MANLFVITTADLTRINVETGQVENGTQVTRHYDDGSTEVAKPVFDVLSTDEVLMRLRARVRDAIEGKRDAVINGGAETPSGRVDSNDRAQQNVLGLVQMASLALAMEAPFETSFRLANNTNVKVDAAAMIAIGRAVGKHVTDAYARSWQLKANVDAATSVARLNDIMLSAASGWAK
jgi:hypothetical protein